VTSRIAKVHVHGFLPIPHDLLPVSESLRFHDPNLGIGYPFDSQPDSPQTTIRVSRFLATMQEDEPSLNIPSLLTLAVVSFFVIRWFFNRDEGSSAGGRPRGRGNIVDPAQVEQISQMFPQLSTRDIMWDLQRNGGSVAATTERILTGRGLETVRCYLQPAWRLAPHLLAKQYYLH
jgi:hypothetical protein